jgi:hypothetical protein
MLVTMHDDVTTSEKCADSSTCETVTIFQRTETQNSVCKCLEKIADTANIQQNNGWIKGGILRW